MYMHMYMDFICVLRKFPPDVLNSEDTMKLLSLSATRIEHMQVSWQIFSHKIFQLFVNNYRYHGMTH